MWVAGTSTVTGGGDPEEVRSIFVSDGVMPSLGVEPLFGRALRTADQDPGAAVRAVVLGYGFWMRRFGGDPSVVGRTIIVNANSREVVGVMPKDFRIVTAEPDLIVPFGFDRSKLMLPGFGFETVARLKPGATIAQASADVARMVPIWMHSWPMVAGVDPSIYETWRITPAIRPLSAEVIGNVARVLWVLFGAVGIVLLVACANVAALMLVRMEGRQNELAVRAALGAGRGRIVRALLAESAILALAGGAIGIGLSIVTIRLLVSYGPNTLPRLHEIAVDARALGFAIAASVLSAAFFGVLPALRYSRAEIASTLHAGGRTASDSRERRTARHGLIVVQIALALVLLVASGLMIRTFRRCIQSSQGSPGPKRSRRLTWPFRSRCIGAGTRGGVDRDIVTAVCNSGVTSAGFATVVPMVGGTPDWDVCSSKAVNTRRKRFRRCGSSSTSRRGIWRPWAHGSSPGATSRGPISRSAVGCWWSPRTWRVRCGVRRRRR